MSDEKGWIGVDLDGTLAHYDHWRGVEHIGEPIGPMVERVKGWLQAGERVKIFTARCDNGPAGIKPIQEWCQRHLGQVLEITNVKDMFMIRLFDDRCVQVRPNLGTLVF